MSDKNRLHPPDLPPPGLRSVEIPNLGPVIDPPFVDVPDFSQYLTPADTSPVEFETIEPKITDERRQQAVDVALASDRAAGKLEGKRYAVLEVGTRSMDRQTDFPLVIIYNYTDDDVVEVTVDQVRRSVHEVTVERYQPALTASEQSQALEMVRDGSQLTEADIDFATGVGLIVEDVNIRSPRYGHRLVDLRFGPENRYLPTAFAIVDLSDGEVVRTGLLPQEGGAS
ncbi:hypothetical protein ACIBG6_05095 [Streptomyces sp. NPDC050842]|uniref:hypothetical protein n=1 Tax=Streptomyces sp. NPDC050842 TaxID=3365636 RepID=UPI0037931045